MSLLARQKRKRRHSSPARGTRGTGASDVLVCLCDQGIDNIRLLEVKNHIYRISGKIHERANSVYSSSYDSLARSDICNAAGAIGSSVNSGGPS